MPGKVKVKIVAGRNLPVMDRSSDTTDAFVEVKLGSTTFKTEVFRKSLNPQWNSEWFKFEVDDEELQDEPLQIRIMDHDTYSAHDAIGKVYVDLNPLLGPHSGPSVTQHVESNSNQSGLGTMLSGWFPVFDTMHGVRGEIFLVVKVELFSDVNRFRQSSCGVRFFNTPGIPSGYNIFTICGFVEELVVNDDPEYQWIDKIRTQRSSNEARQTLFLKLSGEVRRRIGLKTLELGGNAVIGYKQFFDLEGESGVVVRGIGTVASLHKKGSAAETAPHSNSTVAEHNGTERYGSPSNQKLVKLPVVKKKSSESDLSTTPKGLSSSCELHHSTHMVRQVTGSQHIYDLQHEMSEYPFLTLSTYPRNFIVHIGGTVSARSVKLLDRITNPDEPETRDAWWSELRLEVRSHARALGCTFVLGYTEQTSICDEVCILSASGTAAVVDFQQIESFENRTRHSSGGFGMTSSFEREKLPKDQRSKDFVTGFDHQDNPPCSPCHVPYLPSNIPCPVKLSRCNSCRKHKVPDVLLATIEIPRELRVEGRGCLIQARVCRAKREYRSGGDSQAREVSDALPFLEYELHRQLLAKLRVRGMNAVFGLHVEVSIGEKHIIGLATGTAVFLSSLPPGRPPAISATGNKEDQLKVAQLSKKLMDLLVENREFYGIKESVIKHLQELDDEEPKTSDMSEGSDDELPDIHFVADNKDTCILEIDDPSELDIASILADDRPPKSFHCSTTELVPGLDWKNIENNYLAFTRVWQGRGTYPFAQKQLDDCFNILLQGLYFQLRRASPCLISGLRFAVDLPDEETIQITIFGMASRLKESLPARESSETASADASLIFKLDEDQVNGEKKSQREGFQPKNEGSPRDHPVIEITPLSRVPGTKIEKYLGNLNFFFIRESTSIRESGGLSTLVASFVSEVFAIARAHVAALGGNAMVAFTMSQYVLVHNPHKNQGQCLINASGDAVFVSEKHSED